MENDAVRAHPNTQSNSQRLITKDETKKNDQKIYVFVVMNLVTWLVPAPHATRSRQTPRRIKCLWRFDAPSWIMYFESSRTTYPDSCPWIRRLETQDSEDQELTYSSWRIRERCTFPWHSHFLEHFHQERRRSSVSRATVDLCQDSIANTRCIWFLRTWGDSTFNIELELEQSIFLPDVSSR